MGTSPRGPRAARPRRRPAPAVRLRRTVRASPSRAWAACTEPALLARWLTRNAVVDLRVGGAYRDGDGDRGTYLEIRRNRKLRFTWDNPGHCPGTVVALTFEPRPGGGTLVRLAHTGLAGARDVTHMRGGWSEALDLLQALLDADPDQKL